MHVKSHVPDFHSLPSMSPDAFSGPQASCHKDAGGGWLLKLSSGTEHPVHDRAARCKAGSCSGYARVQLAWVYHLLLGLLMMDLAKMLLPLHLASFWTPCPNALQTLPASLPAVTPYKKPRPSLGPPALLCMVLPRSPTLQLLVQKSWKTPTAVARKSMGEKDSLLKPRCIALSCRHPSSSGQQLLARI